MSRRSAVAQVFILAVLVLAPTARGQSCPVYNAPPPPPGGAAPVFDELTGALSVTFRRDVGSPGAYTSTFRVQGTVEGANPFRTFQHLQLRIAGLSGVYATTPIPNPLSGPVSISAGVRLLSATSPERLVQLVAASDTTSSPIWWEVLDELVLRTPDPQGSIRIPKPTCLRSADGLPCTVDVEWESTHVAPQFDHLYVTVESPAWPGKIWRSLAPDTVGGANSGNVKINKLGVTFRLIAANGEYTASEYDLLRLEGTELSAATAVSIPHYGIIAPVDGLAMRRGDPDPNRYLGILANGMFAAANPVESIQAAANLLDDAGMSRVRRTIRWDKLQVLPNGEFDWTYLDGLFHAFSDSGVEPWITLSGMRQGAGDSTLSMGCDPERSDTWPLAHAAEGLWADFVSEAIGRYGPAGSAGLAMPCRNWEIWQEPEFFLCGGFEQWRRLYDIAYPIIKGADPQAQMWAPNVTVVDNRDPAAIDEWVTQTITSGISIDGFALHYFGHHGQRRLLLASNLVKSVRARLDAALQTQGIPLFVTACAHGTPGDTFGFRRLLDNDGQEQFYVDFLATLANAGADSAMWFDATEFVTTSDVPNTATAMLSPNLFPPPEHHRPNPVYCGALRVSEWLSRGP